MQRDLDRSLFLVAEGRRGQNSTTTRISCGVTQQWRALGVNTSHSFHHHGSDEKVSLGSTQEMLKRTVSAESYGLYCEVTRYQCVASQPTKHLLKKAYKACILRETQ